MTVTSSITDHLSIRDLAALREALSDELEVERAQIVELQATVDELTGQSDSDSVLERELAERSRQRSLEVIAEIEHALARLDGAEYGRCERCGGPITLARLEVIPFTRHCVKCPPSPSAIIG
jgi:RNA polymerase-binding protein DksA